MNIKITKGGSGKVNSTKSGSGKLIEKKYIDLFPLNDEIGTILLQGGTYGNGIYTRSFISKILISDSSDLPNINGYYERSSGGTTKFIGPARNDGYGPPSYSLYPEIWWSSAGGYWVLSSLGEIDGEAAFISSDLINWQSSASTWDGKAQIREVYFIKNSDQRITQTFFLGTSSPENFSLVSFDSSYFDINDPIYLSMDKGVTWTNEGSIEDVGDLPTGSTAKALNYVFDPIFYKKDIANSVDKIIATDSELSYVNGIYSRTANPKKVNGEFYYIKDDDSTMSIAWDGISRWQIIDATLRNGMEVLWTSPQLYDWGLVDGGEAFGQYQQPIITYYKNNIITYKEIDPSYLEKVRSYTVDGITIPGDIPLIQNIINAPFNTRKVEIKNNALSYIKYNDDSDVLTKNFKRYIRDYNAGLYPEFFIKDNKKPLLQIIKNDNCGFISTYVSGAAGRRDSTLNIFIRLQRPSEHKRGSFKVRHKRSTFCAGGGIKIGYRSPYYYIPGRPNYKGNFNNFSFVFSFPGTFRSAIFNRPSSFNLMTDYKYNFGEMYMLTMRIENEKISIFINGELQTVAFVPFNPLRKTGYGYIDPLDPSPQLKRSYFQRLRQMPLGPGFYKKDGTVYPYLDQEYQTEGFFISKLDFGPSKFSPIKPIHGNTLNNLDIGVINSYNIALSQSDIKNIYENFRYRYI